MFHPMMSRGPLSFELEFVSLSRRCWVISLMFYVDPWVEMVSVDGILWFCSSGDGLSISVGFCWELPEGCVWVVRLDRV